MSQLPGALIADPTSATTTVSKEDDELFKKFMMRIEELNLSARSHNCLTRSNLKFVGEIVMMSENELSKVKNLGKKSLEEIKSKIVELELDNKEIFTQDLVDAFEQKIAELKG